MWQVSEAYKIAVKKQSRNWKAAVTVSYKSDEIEVFTDANLMGGITIYSQAVSGDEGANVIDIGAAPEKRIELTLIDSSSDLHRYAGASLSLIVSLLLDNGEYEDVPMGVFYVDMGEISRQGKHINIVGYDAMLTYNYTLTDALRASLANCTAYGAAVLLTQYAKCGFDQDLTGFPNSDLQLDFSSTQIVTGWDGIMWIAQLMGCFARINRENKLDFVQIKSTWEWINEDHSLGTIIVEKNISGSERYRTTFTDDRVHIIGVSMPDENNKLITRSGGYLESDCNIVIAMERNPIIKSTYKIEDVLDAVLEVIKTVYFYEFRSELMSDPALDAGDMVRLKGGVINGTNKNNDLIGFITHNTWRYRARQDIVNVGQATDAAVSTAFGQSETTQFYSNPKSQSEKLLDSLSGSTSQLQERVTVIEKGSGPKDRIVSPKYGRALVVQEPYSATHAVSALYICDSSGIVRTTINEMSTGTYAEPRFYYETHLRNPSNSGYDVYSKFGSDNSSGYKGIEAKWFDGGHYSITISSKKGTDGCSIEFRRPRNGTSTQDKFTLCIDEEGGTPCLKLITDTQSGYHSYKATLEQLS